MNVLSFSYCFPHAAAPNWGVFVERRLAALARRPGVQLQVVSPVPSFPLITRWRRGSGERGLSQFSRRTGEGIPSPNLSAAKMGLSPLHRLRQWLFGAVPAREQWHGLTVHRPRFFCVPGVLKSLDARFYARGVGRWMEQRCQASGVGCQEGAGDGQWEMGDGEGAISAGHPSVDAGENSWRPDVLDAHFVWPDGVAVSLLAGRFGLPYVVTLRGKLYPCLEVPAQRRQCAAALRGAAAVISVDARMARIACELGAPPDRVSIIPNGVDLDRFQPADRLEARRRLGLPEQGRLLVTVAHLGVRKGHREAIAALTRLPGDVRLLLVGGDLHQGDTARLRRLAASLGVGDRLLLAGVQPPDRVPDYFAAADAGLLASYREGCPNAVLECLASGRPVVATDVGAVPDIVEPGRNGEIVPVRDTDALTVALNGVLNRSWDAGAVCRSVQSWDEVAQEVERVLEVCCEVTKAR